MKKILLFLFVAGMIGGFVGYKMWTKPHAVMGAASSDIQVAARDLYTAFSDDEATANSQYLDKVIEVTGVVESTEAGNKVMLGVGDDAMGGVYCELDPLTEHARTDFAEGESITLKCNCTGFTMVDVQMTRCVEVKR